MSIIDDIARLKDYLQSHGRMSYRMIKREFQFDDDDLEDVIEELVEIQQVAKREEKALAWLDGEAAAAESPAPSARVEPRAPSTYTPKHLADKILQSRSALEGERKQVTILFADVKGSMDIAGHLDPEDWHSLLDRFFAILSDGVHRFEGTVNQYTGDGIMAIFGAPIAHEDHAQRACYAALQLRDELRRFSVELRVERGIDFSTRIGINSGEVIVGKIGDDLRMDYTAQGYVVGIAQRLESIAESGHVYISEYTARLVEGFFKLSDLGASQLAGADNPVGIFDLDGSTSARTRMDISRARGLTQFVGRADEMRTLEAALARAVAGHGQVIGVVGEPGLGKSRLCFEFVERCRAQGLPVYEAHCPSHGKTIPFIPVLELFRNYFGVSDQDSPAETRQKIAGALMLLDPEMHTGLPILFEFMGVGDPHNPSQTTDPDVRQRQLFEMLHKISRVQNARGVASVIFIDDLHWIDSWSDEFVAQMVEATQASHTLLLVNFRPEYQAAWTTKPYYQQFPLVPLGPSDVREMVASLLGDDESVLTLTERIMKWTGGNPLYSEEVINTLIETTQLTGSRGDYRLTRDVESLEVPATVQAIIAARIDRLDDRSKQVLHSAAVIGKEFSRPLIERVTAMPNPDLSSAVEHLKAFDFIFETALYPTIEYSFKHPLVHEVAYDMQLKEPLAQRHRAVAEALEEFESERLDENASMIAYHWDRANDNLNALHWHHRAARVASVAEPRVAHQHWSRLRDLVDNVEQTQDVLALGAEACSHLNALGWRLGGSEEMSNAYFEDGKAMAERTGNKVLLSQIIGNYAGFRGVTLGYASDYVRYADEAVTVASQTDDRQLEFGMIGYKLWGLVFSGKFQESIQLGEDVAVNMPADEQFSLTYTGIPAPFVLHAGLSLAYGSMGDFKRSIQYAERAKSSGEASADTRAVAEALGVWLLAVMGEFGQLTGHGLGGAAEMENAASTYIRFVGSAFFGASQYYSGNHEDARETLEHALHGMGKDQVGGAHRPFAVGALAECEAALGHYHNAKILAAECIDYCIKRDLYVTPTPWFGLAKANIGLGAEEGALRALKDAQSVIERTAAKAYQPFLHEIQAEFGKVFAKNWDWAVEGGVAKRLFHELGASGQVERVVEKFG